MIDNYKEGISEIFEQLEEKFFELEEEDQKEKLDELWKKYHNLLGVKEITKLNLRVIDFVFRMAELNNDYIKMVTPEARVDKKKKEATRKIEEAVEALAQIRGNDAAVRLLKDIDIHTDPTPTELHKAHIEAYQEILIENGIPRTLVTRTIIPMLKGISKQ